jgi:hypothetical protein
VVLKGQLSTLFDEVKRGDVEPKAGAVLTQIANARARLVSLEREFREIDELERRLENIEKLQEDDRWRA